MSSFEFLLPEWPVPANVRAVMTTRAGGASAGPYASFNIATHVGDEPDAVAENRRRLRESLELPAEPEWLSQVHGVEVAVIHGRMQDQADAAVAFAPGAVAAVMVADCLPVFLASRDGDRIGLAHAGWRGLAAGVIGATVEALDVEPGQLVAWLGPCIGPGAFEVGAEVRAAFKAVDPDSSADFRAGRAGHWFADLPALARRALARAGVADVHGGTHCTVSEPTRFFSYRRDGRTGRMAALLWLA